MLLRYFGKGKSQVGNEPPRRLLVELEEIVGEKKEQWSLSLLRSLWPTLARGLTRRGRSLHHETAWLSLAGYVLRPGYGAAQDDARIEELWRLYQLGLSHPKEARANVQWWILWRRVSGGLTPQQQLQLLVLAQKSIAKKQFSDDEAYRLIGSLEKLPVNEKVDLLNTLVKQFSKGKISEATAWAFGRLACRISIRAESDCVVPPEHVERWFAKLEELDWTVAKYAPLVSAFMLAAKYSNVSKDNLSSAVLSRVSNKLMASGYTSQQLQVLENYVELKASDEGVLFGESLPIGLQLES